MIRFNGSNFLAAALCGEPLSGYRNLLINFVCSTQDIDRRIETDQYSGFHIGGTVGGVVVGARLPEESLFEFIGGWGGGAALATGYDWWISSQWSLGILGRIIYAGVFGEDTAEDEDTEESIKAEEESSYFSAGLFFTAVYH